MDVGQIKWAGHYNSRTGEKNRYGFITRMADSEEFFFHREKIREGSALLSRFDDSDGQFVVFDTVPDPRKKNQFRAVNVCFLEEVEAEKLVSGLSEKTLASPAVRRLLLAKCPGTVLGNDPCAYFPLLDDVGVRRAFTERYRAGTFGENLTSAVSAYLGRRRKVAWNAHIWELIDWDKEPADEVRRLCVRAADAGVDVSPLLKTVPTLWREDKDFLRALPAKAIQDLILDWKDKLTREDFEVLFSRSGKREIQALLCRMVPVEWAFAVPGAVACLPDDRILPMIGKIPWERTDEQTVRETEPLLMQLQHTSSEGVIHALTGAAIKAEIFENSPWWPHLPVRVRDAVLQKYRDAGLIPDPNVAVNPKLESFLERYFQGENRRVFSDQQKAAVQSVDGVTLLFAVPGSGKTTVIVARAGYMAYGMQIPPGSHLIMTYGKSAALEMKERYKATFSGGGCPEFRTIHSLCLEVVYALHGKGEKIPLLLKSPDDDKNPKQRAWRDRQIASAISGLDVNDDSLPTLIGQIYRRKEKQISAEAAKEVEWLPGISLEEAWSAWDRKEASARKIFRQIIGKEAYDEDANALADSLTTMACFVKNRMLPPEEIEKITFRVEKKDEPFEPVYTAYQDYLRRENLMDYDDMLYRAYLGLKKYPDILERYQERYPYVSLDEAQDTSLLQHEIIALLVQKHGNLFMVGDDDQSIYAFRGSVPSEMLDFRRRYKTGRKLLMGVNYRADRDLVRSAERFVKANVRRENKFMRPQSPDPGKIQLVLIPNLSAQYTYILNAAESYLGQGRETLAILFRWNVSAFPVIAFFYRFHIPFVCEKQQETIDSVLKKQEVKRIVNLLKYSQRLSDINAFKEAWYVCYRNVLPKDSLEVIEQIWRQNPFRPVADVVMQILEAEKPELTEVFRKAHEKVRQLSTLPPRNAIAYIIRQREYGFLNEDEDNSIVTWMRIYAILSAAEMYSDMTSFLQMIDDIQNQEENKKRLRGKRIFLSTMHSAKGMEFDRVILIDLLDDITPGPETGDEVWYDSEEERRLFYVAVTRAKHELDILQTDVYHDRHQKPSRFIGEYHAADPSVKVVSYNAGNGRGPLRLNVTHFVIRDGPSAGIYTGDEEMGKIMKGSSSSVMVFKCKSYKDAIICMHKGAGNLRSEQMEIPADLPEELTERLWNLFGVRSAGELSAERIREIRMKAELFLETGRTDYRQCAREYALLYLPVNLYKVWIPLMRMLPSARLPVDGKIRILEIGAGPGTATLGVLLFYQELARRNPRRTFEIEYYIIERELAFIEVMNRLVKWSVPKNLRIHFNKPVCEDVTEAIRRFAGKEMDLILECNMLNPNECIESHQLADFVVDICRALRNYGSFLMLEPEGPEMMTHLRSIISLANRTDSLLYEYMTCDSDSVDVSHMQIVQDQVRSGLRVKGIETHGFSYALLERKDVEVKTK